MDETSRAWDWRAFTTSFMNGNSGNLLGLNWHANNHLKLEITDFLAISTMQYINELRHDFVTDLISQKIKMKKKIMVMIMMNLVLGHFGTISAEMAHMGVVGLTRGFIGMKFAHSAVEIVFVSLSKSDVCIL